MRFCGWMCHTCTDGLISPPSPFSVGSWTLPKPQIRMKLPMDFPTHQPFYRVAVLSSTEDPQDLQIELLVRKQKLHLQGGESKVHKRLLVEIGRKNGSLWLVRRPEDLDVYSTAMQGMECFIFLFCILTRGRFRRGEPASQDSYYFELRIMKKTRFDPRSRMIWMRKLNRK